jgi:hypothetical protein
MNILSMIWGSHFPSPLRVLVLIATTDEARPHSGVSYYFPSPLRVQL